MVDFSSGSDSGTGTDFSAGPDFSAGSDFMSGSDFAVSVRAAEPVLKFSKPPKKADITKDLLKNIAGAVMVGAVLSLFCVAEDALGLIPFMMAGPVVFLAITMVEALRPGRLRWLVAGVMAVVLIVAAVVFHGRILGGLAVMMNNFYDVAEYAQAYLYTRFPVSDTASESFGAVWISCVLGLVTALAPADKRRTAIMLLAMIVMFLVAYYGIIPSTVCIAVMLAALILTVSRGSVLSVLPLLLAGMLVFGAIVLIDPAENYDISRMDENFRDRFAFNSALIESPEDTQQEEEDVDELDDEEEDFDEGDSMFENDYGTYIAIGTAVIIAALIGAAIYLIAKRLKKKQKAVRAGLDSKDPKTAVTAMFPYSVRWLRACGIRSEDTREDTFAALGPIVAREFTGDYGRRFGSMYDLWKEAAYSDHAVSEENANDMKSFMGDTVKLAQTKCTFKDKLKIKFKYTL